VTVAETKRYRHFPAIAKMIQGCQALPGARELSVALSKWERPKLPSAKCLSVPEDSACNSSALAEWYAITRFSVSELRKTGIPAAGNA
jgi:hypothetical protein